MPISTFEPCPVLCRGNGRCLRKIVYPRQPYLLNSLLFLRVLRSLESSNWRTKGGILKRQAEPHRGDSHHTSTSNFTIGGMWFSMTAPDGAQAKLSVPFLP